MRKRNFAASQWVNPNPARGAGVLTVDQLKYYLRKFRDDPEYGICGVRGGWPAFMRFCGDFGHYVRDRLVTQRPRANWIPARVQLTLSRKVRQVLAGEVCFRENLTDRKATWFLPEVPQPLRIGGGLPRTYNMYIEHGPFGPRIRRLPTDF